MHNGQIKYSSISTEREVTLFCNKTNTEYSQYIVIMAKLREIDCREEYLGNMIMKALQSHSFCMYETNYLLHLAHTVFFINFLDRLKSVNCKL